MSNLPLIVGYGGINAAGRSIFDLSHRRMLFDSIDTKNQTEVLQSLGHLMGTDSKEKILQKTLIRTIDDDFFKDKSSLKKIVDRIQNDDTLIIWQMNLPGRGPVPDDEHIENFPKLGHIGSPCFLFHSKYPRLFSMVM